MAQMAGLTAPWPGPAAEIFPSLGLTQSWCPSMSPGIQTGGILLGVEHVASRTQKAISRKST